MSDCASASSAYKVLRVGKGVLAWFAPRVSSCYGVIIASSLLIASSFERKLASDSSVGLSYRMVGARSMLNLAPSALVNSTAERESKPADISGAFVSISVPVISWATSWTIFRTSCTSDLALISISSCGTLICDVAWVVVAARSCSSLLCGLSRT